MESVPGVCSEEIIFSGFDEGWDSELPIKILTYSDGSMDLHRQTGSSWNEHMKIAEDILNKRGLMIDRSDGQTIGPTGLYQKLIRTKQEKLMGKIQVLAFNYEGRAEADYWYRIDEPGQGERFFEYLKNNADIENNPIIELIEVTPQEWTDATKAGAAMS